MLAQNKLTPVPQSWAVTASGTDLGDRPSGNGPDDEEDGVSVGVDELLDSVIHC